MMSVPEDIRSCLAGQLEHYDASHCIQLAPIGSSLAEWDDLGVTRVTLDENFDLGHDLCPVTHRAQLAIVIDAPNVLSHETTRQLLGGLRNYAADAIIAAFAIDQARRTDRWSTSDFLGLGFRRLGLTHQLDSAYWLYRYDIRDYKITPDWLNSGHWANPEQWGRHRW